MKATEIVGAIAKLRNEDDAHRLQLSINTRREEVRARVEAIRPARVPALDPPERAQALRLGLDAIRALDKEHDELVREYKYLDEMEYQIIGVLRSLKIERIGRELPKALKTLPAASERVRSCVTNLDNAIEQICSIVHTIGEWPLLTPDQAAEDSFPLSDEELADLLRLRDLVWQVRTVCILTIPQLNADDSMQRWPQSWPLLYEWRDEVSFRLRTAPRRLSAREDS